MKVLVIGSGGREHAIAYKLSLSKHVDELHALPGNPGIAKLGKCVAISVEDNQAILNYVKENNFDLTVIGPEVPLCNGLADLLESNGFKVFGPKKYAATLEGSKSFSKNFMDKYNIPTAKYVETTTYEEAVNALDKFSYPLVIKADGLAAGKGVVICENKEMALETLNDLLVNKSLKDAANKLVIEEFLEGFECSLLCFTDGKSIVPMVSAKDHKQIYDNNIGPNTGGMGTVSPNPFLPDGIESILNEEVVKPFLKGIQEEKMDYKGVIFIGLMIKDNKPKVLEFNVRFGDPETQVILLRLESDLFEIMNAVANQKLDEVEVKWSNLHAACLVLASGGYPASYKKGLEISNIDKVDEEIIVFHAGTALKDNKLVTSGGRVLNICALGNSLQDVREKVYKAANIIDFEGKYYRKDIGLN